MLHDRLVALRANVGNSAEDVQLGHIASRGAGRDFVAHGAVAVHGSFRPVSGEASDVHEVKLRQVAVAHVALVHEHDSAQALEPSVSVVVRVDRGVELVMRADRCQQEPTFTRVDVPREWRRRKFRATGRGLENPVPRRLDDAESVRVAGAPVEVLEALEHARHGIANPVIVFDVPLPRRPAVG